MKLSDLLQFDNIIVQCHDNPDADALASGFGVYEYLRMNGKSPRLVYGGKNIIHKSNLVLMVDSLGIPIEHVDFLDNPQLLVTVDCQYGGGNVTFFKAENVAVIDHHRVSGELPAMNRVMSYMGSCATIVWDMLREEGVEINRNLATALYYGLYTDTGEFTEITHSLDRDLRDEADFDNTIVAKFRNANMSLEELDIAATALLGRDYTGLSARPRDPAGQVPPAVPPHRDALPPAGQRRGGRGGGAGRAGRGPRDGSGLRRTGAGPHHPPGRPGLPAGAARPSLLGEGAGAAFGPAGPAGAAAQPAAGSLCPAVGGLRPGGFRAQRRDRPQLLSGLLPRAGAALHLPDPV